MASGRDGENLSADDPTEQRRLQEMMADCEIMQDEARALEVQSRRIVRTVVQVRLP